MTDMSLKNIDAWLEKEIKDIDEQRKNGRAGGHMGLDSDLAKARVKLVAKLADVRVKLALPL